MRIFLIGGGHDAATVYRPFVGAVKDGAVKALKDGPVVAIVRDDGADTNADRWVEGLHEAGAADVRALVVSPDRPPMVEDLDGAAGVFVAGGLTPGYRDTLVKDGTAWQDPVRSGLPYAGFSAGAAIAPGNALVGGYLAPVGGRDVEVCDSDFSEGLDAVTVLPGLGLVPFTVEVHAAQWGMHYRLVHAMLGGERVIDEGWAIDEHTTLEVTDGALSVHGTGTATRMRRVGDRIELTVHPAGVPVVLPEQ